MYKKDLLCHKTKPSQAESYLFDIYVYNGCDIK